MNYKVKIEFAKAAKSPIFVWLGVAQSPREAGIKAVQAAKTSGYAGAIRKLDVQEAPTNLRS